MLLGSCESSTSVLGLKGVMYWAQVSHCLPCACVLSHVLSLVLFCISYVALCIYPPEYLSTGMWFGLLLQFIKGAVVFSLSPEFSTEYIVWSSYIWIYTIVLCLWLHIRGVIDFVVIPNSKRGVLKILYWEPLCRAGITHVCIVVHCVTCCLRDMCACLVVCTMCAVAPCVNSHHVWIRTMCAVAPCVHWFLDIRSVVVQYIRLYISCINRLNCKSQQVMGPAMLPLRMRLPD